MIDKLEMFIALAKERHFGREAEERGGSLLKHCQETLAQAEQKIRILDGGSLREFSAPAKPTDAADEGGRS